MSRKELQRRYLKITSNHQQVGLLFDLVVEHELESTLVTEEAMKAQLDECSVKFGDQTTLIQRAKVYAQTRR